MRRLYLYNYDKLILGNKIDLLNEYINGILNLSNDFFNDSVVSIETDKYLVQVYKTPTNYLLILYSDNYIFSNIKEIYGELSKAILYDDLNIFKEYLVLNNIEFI